jgi:hypothetical protein
LDGLQRICLLFGVFLDTSVSQLMSDEEVDVVSVAPVFFCISPFFVAFVLDQTLQFVEVFHSADVVDGGSLWHKFKIPWIDYPSKTGQKAICWARKRSKSEDLNQGRKRSQSEDLNQGSSAVIKKMD